ncbi:group I truncated hemoglobin [Nitrospira sp. Nam74]
MTGFAVVGLLMMGAGCASEISGTAMKPESEMKQPMQPSLYERLGKKEAITAVVDDFVGRVASDGRINGKFANANIPRLKAMLVEQICAASGGPCTYTGRDMKTTHAGMAITNEQFDALVGDLVTTLNKFHVPEREKKELLGALGPVRKDVVTTM